jgi:hypothetical protein
VRREDGEVKTMKRKVMRVGFYGFALDQNEFKKNKKIKNNNRVIIGLTQL